MSGTCNTQLALRCLSLFIVSFSKPGMAATLKSETVEAWNSYVSAARSRIQNGAGRRQEIALPAGKSEPGDKWSGKPVVYPMTHTPVAVPGGLIHDWIGKTFIPDTTVSAVVLMMRDYRHYRDYFRPGVISASPLNCSELQDHFTLTLASKSLGVDSALEGDYMSTYFPVDRTHWYSVSETAHMREIERFGAQDQHILPEGEGRGFVWKLFTITYFEERDRGVAVEVEALALSRDVPNSLRWIAMPIVKRVSRGSLVTSLQQTSEAVISRSGTSTVAGGQQSGLSIGSRPKASVHSYR